MTRKFQGFTLIELIVVIGIIAILAAIVIVAVNPARQFALARNTQRRSDTSAILNAVHQHAADNNGVLSADITTATTATCIGTQTTPACKDLSDDLVSGAVSYISAMPTDPGGPGLTAGTDANTQYTVLYNATTKRVTVAAPNGELSQTISVTR